MYNTACHGTKFHYILKTMLGSRNRPDIRLNPVPAGYPASISDSGSGPVSKKFAGFLPNFSSKNVYNLKS